MRKTKLSKRVLSLLLVALTVAGIFPSAITTASADHIDPKPAPMLNVPDLKSLNPDGTFKKEPTLPNQIILKDYYKVTTGTYHISAMNEDITHFTCNYDLGNGIEAKGFCTQYGAHMDASYEGKAWVEPQLVTTGGPFAEELVRYLDYYAYQQLLHKEVHQIYFPELGPCSDATDLKIRNGEVESPYAQTFKDYPAWTQASIDELANQGQVLVWSAIDIWENQGRQFKPFSESTDRALAARDRQSFLASFSVPNTLSQASDWFTQIYSIIMSPGTKIPHFKHYIYKCATDSGAQNMLVSLIPDPEPIVDGFYVKVQKMMDGQPLPNAKFQVYYDSECKMPVGNGDMVSDSSGIALSKALKPADGTPANAKFHVYVKETESPSPEIGLSDNVVDILVDPSVNNTSSNPATSPLAVFEDIPQKPKGILQKIDAVTGEGIGPATFKFENDSGSKTFTSNAEGALDLQWWNPGDENYIAPGNYKVTEETAPQGYLKTDKVFDISFWLEDGKAYNSGPIVFEDYKKFRIELLKVDENNQPLPGAEFEIWKDGTKLTTKTSGDDGMVVLEDLESGEYELVEIKAPSGKVIPVNHVFRFVLDEGSEMRVYKAVCVNNDLPELIIKKLEKGTNEPLEGAQFKVTIDGNEVPTEMTGISGTIIITPERYGEFMDAAKETHTVVVKEIKAPDGYDIDQPDTQTLTLKKGQTKAMFTFTDSKHGEIIIHKFKEGTTERLSGAEFKVVIDGKELDTYTTDGNGEIHITSDEYSAIWDGKAEEHSVTVTETKAPKGFLKADPDTQTLMMKKGQKLLEFAFYDKPYPSILLIKRDKETQDPLPGATFDISIDGQKIPGCPFTTDANGEIKIDYNVYKDYLNEENTGGWAITATELTAPEGYNLDNQPESGNRTVTQTLKPGQSLIEFEFEDSSYRKIRVIKKDAQTNWPLEGAEFLLHSVDGLIPDRTGTTAKDGSFTFDKLPNGTYELRETKPPKGYSEKGSWADGGQDVKTIILTADSEPVVTYERLNTSKSGILIRKIDAVTKLPLAGVTFRITPRSPLTAAPFDRTTEDDGIIALEGLDAGTYTIEEIGVPEGYVIDPTPKNVQIKDQQKTYTVTFENRAYGRLYILKLDEDTRLPLKGARFSIETAAGIHVCDTDPTDETGYTSVSNLKPGRYCVKEIVVPEGHVLDITPQYFEVKNDDSGKVYELVFYNQKKTELMIRKYDEDTNISLTGAFFKITRPNGTIVEENAKVNEQGLIVLKDMEEGDYLIQEVTAPDGYLLNNEVYTVHLQYGKVGYIEIPNKKPGGVAVRKIDADTGLPLAGATFTISKLNGGVIGQPKVSGADGYVRWNELQAGWYSIKETEAPKGYQLISKPINVEVKDFAATEVEMKNSQFMSITVVKKDSSTEVPLSGAEFEVRSIDGTLVDTLVTGADGSATTKRLEPGTYKITETKAPSGYLLSNEVKDVVLTADKPQSVTFYDTPTTTITFHKYDAVTKEPIPGAEFEIRTAEGVTVKAYTTDASGTVTTEKMEPGIYKIVETKTPPGYVDEDTSVTVELKAGKNVNTDILNWPETTIRIQKVDAVTGNPLQDAEFEVLDANGNVVDSGLTSDKTGWAHSKVLPYGKYTVREVKAPSGYALNNEPFPVTLGKGIDAIVRIEDQPDTTIIIEKVDKATRKALAGAVFELRYDTGHGDCTLVGTYTTDELGMIRTEPMKPGFYMLKEIKAPVGYEILKEETRICVKAGEYNHFVIENVASGTLTVRKIDSVSGKPVAGAVFKLENADTSDLVGLQETDANGEANWYGLKEGFYIITETQAPDGYTKYPCPKTIQVEYGKHTYVDFKDDENGSLKIVLQDKHTGEYLAEGHFIVIRESDQTIVFDGRTDTTGSIVVGTLIPGEYTIKQVDAPNKYTKIDIELKAKVLIGEQAVVYFKDETAGLVIEKIDAQTPSLLLEGARFQVKRESDGIVVGEYVTGKDGLALVDGLSDGLYTVTELVAPTGYALDAKPQVVHVRGGTTAHATFQDTRISSITLHFIDKDSRQPVSGVSVEIYDANGTLINTYVSDTTGLVQTDRIAAGTYRAKVVKFPDGVNLAGDSEASIELKDGIESTYTFELVAKQVLKIMATDSANKGIAGMEVSIKTLEGAVISGKYVTGSDGSVSVTLKPGTYIVTEVTPPNNYTKSNPAEQQVQVLTSGATVVFKHGNVYGVQITTTCAETNEKVGKAVYTIKDAVSGKLVGEFTGAENGILFTQLIPGHYVITPKTAPSGFQFTSVTPRTVEVKADAITSVDFTVNKNSAMKVQVVDGTTKKGLYGVRLLVKDGTQIVAELTTDNNGYVYLNDSLTVGSYTIEMLNTPAGYIPDTIPKSINTLVGETTSIVWALYTAGGQLQVKVTSADYNRTLDKKAGSALHGAVFEIENVETKQIVGQMISNVQGIAASSALPVGFYRVKMISAPAYYAINETWNPEMQIRVNNDIVQEAVTVTSTNIASNVTLQSNQKIKAGLTMRVDIVTASNDSNVQLENFFMHIKFPTDCARPVAFNTGAWNLPTKYKIMYQTNMRGYETLASDLVSTTTHQYGISTQALGLQAGEYVTDLRLEFGKVPAGFALTQKGYWTQYIMTTVPNGYKVISSVEVGGQQNAVNQSTQHIDNTSPYSSTGAIVIVDAGLQNGDGSAAMSGNSSAWTTDTGLWTAQVVNPSVKTAPVSTNYVPSNYMPSYIPISLPKTGY